MRRAIIALCLLPLPLAAQNTVPVEDAPFAAAGALAPRLDGAAESGGVFTPLPPERLTTAEVSEAEVLDAAGNRIGRAAGVLFENDMPLALVFNVGGVMGVFERPVAVPLINTDIGISGSGMVRIILNVTAEELRGMDRYEGPELVES